MKKQADSQALLSAKDPLDAFRYALNVLKGRFVEAEPTIATDPYYAYRYALEVVKGRWKEAEANISTSQWIAYCYAIDVLGLNEVQAKTWGRNKG